MAPLSMGVSHHDLGHFHARGKEQVHTATLERTDGRNVGFL